MHPDRTPFTAIRRGVSLPGRFGQLPALIGIGHVAQESLQGGPVGGLRLPSRLRRLPVAGDRFFVFVTSRCG